MQIEDQSEIVAFLSSERAYAGLGLGGAVKRIETHISVVFLIGDRAFKLKRAVRFPYLDFSDPDKRRAGAEAELALNRRTAPELYLGLAPLVRQAGGLRLGEICQTPGDAPPDDVGEWLVVMRRFRQRDLFDRMAGEGRLEPRLMAQLADRIASFHATAEIRRDAGGLAGMRHAATTVREALAECPPGIFDPGAVASFTAETDRRIERLGPLLEARREAGLCRHCHGDLHLRNICLIDGRPTLFDCIEFSEEIAVIDVLYDLAFLLMDLWHRGLAGHANTILNRTLRAGGPGGGADAFSGLAALPLFLSSRAAIRAHVTATMAGPAATKELAAEARAYFDLAVRLLSPPAPRLIGIGGLPGTGKTTLARALAPLVPPVPGAVILRSDVIRKELAGVDPLTRLGPEGYTRAMTRRTYEALLTRAGAVLASGHSAIVDAVSARPKDRADIEAVARDHGAGFTGLWLEAPVEALEERIAQRRADASDATVEVVRKSARYGTGTITWHRIDASRGAERVAKSARTALRGAGDI